MEDITVEELKLRLNNLEKPVIIDVRETWEYDEFNIGAVNIPLGELMLDTAKFPEDKSVEIIVHCKSGHRSAMAKQLLQAQGYTHVRNLLGGMMQWQVGA